MPFANRPTSATKGAHGYLRWNTTVLAFVVVMFLIAASRYPQPFDCTRASSIENLTSADVIVFPFENLTPGLSLNVYVLTFFETVQLFASHGLSVLPSFAA